MSYDNNNRGQIWRNEKKTHDKQPDLTGSLIVEGVEYWVSAWKRKPDANPKAPALSFSIQRKEEVHEQGYQQARQAVSTPSLDDFEDPTIPF